jgi:hypothetical protein
VSHERKIPGVDWGVRRAPGGARRGRRWTRPPDMLAKRGRAAKPGGGGAGAGGRVL